MKKILTRHHISFKNACAGLRWAVQTQPNFRVHLALSILALIISRVLSVTPTELIVIIFTIIWGLSAEMINTSLESMTDLITQEWKAEAKIAKDVAAGMMLLVSFGAILVAIVIFIPKILALFS